MTDFSNFNKNWTKQKLLKSSLVSESFRKKVLKSLEKEVPDELNLLG